jgi:hypothetical protein
MSIKNKQFVFSLVEISQILKKKEEKRDKVEECQEVTQGCP